MPLYEVTTRGCHPFIGAIQSARIPNFHGSWDACSLTALMRKGCAMIGGRAYAGKNSKAESATKCTGLARPRCCRLAFLIRARLRAVLLQNEADRLRS